MPCSLKELILPFATSQTIVPTLKVGKESPDSTEQCTGEEPAVYHPELAEGYKHETVPQKMTSTPSLLHKWRRGDGRVKT